jgi:acetylornithine deacetylase/succinyl-diaminopimelate desuccinylase-like protein
MSREAAIAAALRYFDDGSLLRVLESRIAFRTESQVPGKAAHLEAYLRKAIAPDVEHLGFTSRIVANPCSDCGPFLIAHRREGPDLPTVLIYGHGDTTLANEALWRSGLSPLRVTVEGDRWYGRGSADNKGQHTINLSALAIAMDSRGGRLGFNATLLLEMGEELGSPGLRDICERFKDELKADVLIASDGPRVSAERPTVFLGGRGVVNFDLTVDLREGAHHSGNWGGLLRNPGTVLANAIGSMVDSRGQILVSDFRPPPISRQVQEALKDIVVGGGSDDPDIDEDWGEPDLTNEERLYAWNALEVLTFQTGDPERPQNAIPPRATARLQLRFVVGTRIEDYVAIIRKHLDEHGFRMVEVRPTKSEVLSATRLDLDDPWVEWALSSIAKTTNTKPALLPNLGGSLPNELFADVLGMPTLWVPHSYPACAQHAPNEHLLAGVAREGLAIMTGLFWDVAETGIAMVKRRSHPTSLVILEAGLSEEA